VEHKIEKENRVAGAQLRNAAEFKYFDFGTVIRNESYIHNKKMNTKTLQRATRYLVSNFIAISFFKKIDIHYK
jgi:hypothetical protein